MSDLHWKKLCGILIFIAISSTFLSLTSSFQIFSVNAYNGSETQDAASLQISDEEWSSFKIFGRMHPAIVHFPLAWIVLLVFTDIPGLVFKKPNMKEAGFWLLGTVVAAFVPALASGWINLSNIEIPDSDAMIHRNLAFVGFGLCSGALLIRMLKKNQLNGAFKWIYLGLIVSAALCISVTGHLGGKMVFGSDYLPF